MLAKADAPHACDALPAALRETVIPSLRRFPRMGRRHLDQAPQSTEAITHLARRPASAAGGRRMLGSDDHLILYAVNRTNATVHAVTIRQHRQASFDFASLWSGAGREDG